MADLNTDFPAWLVPRTGDQSTAQIFQSGMQHAMQQQVQLKHLQLQQDLQQFKQKAAEQQVEGNAALGQVMQKATQENTWDSPETESEIWGVMHKHPWLAESDAFKAAIQNVQQARRAKNNLELLTQRGETQQEIANAKITAQLQAQEAKFDNLLKMEDLKQEHRTQIETLKGDIQMLRDSLKPTRTGLLVHDLSATDLSQMNRELDSLKAAYQKGDIKATKNPGMFGGTKETPLQVFQRMEQEIMKKYDAKRIGSPAPAATSGAPSVPADPSQRQAGTVYQTPKGPYKWNGTGWEQP